MLVSINEIKKYVNLDGLTAEEIAQSLIPVDLDFTVVVHGDTNVTTVLHTKDDKVTMPEITVPDDKLFKGFALTSGGEVALDVAKDATLKYDNLKDLVAEEEAKAHLKYLLISPCFVIALNTPHPP